MAAALARRAMGDVAEVVSAGVEPWPHLHRMTRPTLLRRGIELDAREHPKPVAAICDRGLALVVTIGDPARDKLPRALPGGPLWVHWDINDPADADPTPDQSEAAFERAASEIEARLPDILRLARTLTTPPNPAVSPVRQ